MVRSSFTLAALALALAAPEAWPCGNSMREHRVPRSPEEQLLVKGNADFQRKDYAAALEKAGKVLSLAKSGSPIARRAGRLAGESALRGGKYEEAIGYLTPFAVERGAEPYYRARLAEAQVGAGKAALGRPALEELARADLMPDADGWVALARARLDGGDQRGAVAAVDEALAAEPNHATARALKAQLTTPATPATPPPAGEVKASTRT